MEEFITNLSLNQNIDISFTGFVINVLGTALLSFLLGKLYVNYGNSFSNKKDLARNFILLSLITMLVITIVKSSLALSLGLVGALSIVRFRTAIKEPEELMYLFFCISIGLGFGADQRLITTVAFVLISGLVVLLNKKSVAEDTGRNLILKIRSKGANKLTFDEVISLLSDDCERIDLRRLEDSKELLEVSFLVELSSYEVVQKMKEKLSAKDEDVVLNLLDNKGIISL